MLWDAIFPPGILFFFFAQGGRDWGENKQPIFFLVLTITPAVWNGLTAVIISFSTISSTKQNAILI